MDNNTCPECGRDHLTDEQMTIGENGNPVCIECAEKEN